MSAQFPYRIGDEIARISTNGNDVVRGVVRAVSVSGGAVATIRDFLCSNNYTPEFIDAFLNDRLANDPEFMDKPIYIMEPFSSPGLCTLEEARNIMSGITDEQYEFISGITEDKLALLWGQRLFLVLDSEVV